MNEQKPPLRWQEGRVSKEVDKTKVDARTKAFMEFFEKQLNVTFMDVTNCSEVKIKEVPEVDND